MKSPIGIFDSGLGGLSVAARIIEMIPNERIVYFADNAHVPYGERPLEEIKEFARGITDFLVEKGAKAVVMACNMSSAVALEETRKRHPDIPIIGVIEPGARAAINVSYGEPIGVLATTGTVNSGAYVHTVASFDSSIAVFQQACPKFVPLVESGEAGSEEAEAAACTYVSLLLRNRCSTVILGCTHYPFLKKAIESAAGKSVRIIDPAEETARALQNILIQQSIASNRREGAHEFYASGDTSAFASLGSAFLGMSIGNVEQATWGIDLGKVEKLESWKV